MLPTSAARKTLGARIKGRLREHVEHRDFIRGRSAGVRKGLCNGSRQDLQMRGKEKPGLLVQYTAIVLSTLTVCQFSLQGKNPSERLK